MEVHEMRVNAQDDRGVVLECDECGRVVSVGSRGEFDPIVRGDQFARHIGGTFDTVLAASADQN